MPYFAVYTRGQVDDLVSYLDRTYHRRYTLTPQRMLEVITAGYPGTAMPAFASLGSDLRRGLVEYAGSLYEAQPRR
jgi:hypothetical protein